MLQIGTDTLSDLADGGSGDLDGHPPVLSYILLMEGHGPAKMSSNYVWGQAMAMLKKAWDEKYSRVYCDEGNEYHTLDSLSVQSSHGDWVYSLCSPGQIGADLNRVVGDLSSYLLTDVLLLST